MNLHYQNFVSFLKKYCYDHIEDIDGYDSNGHINLYFNRMIPLNLRISTELRPKFIDRFISKLEIFLSNDDICNDNKDITIIFGKERHKKIIFDYFLIQNYPLKEFKTLGGILFANIVQSEVINYLFDLIIY